MIKYLPFRRPAVSTSSRRNQSLLGSTSADDVTVRTDALRMSPSESTDGATDVVGLFMDTSSKLLEYFFTARVLVTFCFWLQISIFQVAVFLQSIDESLEFVESCVFAI